MWTPADQRAYNARYYAEHRDEEIERVRLRQAATIELLRGVRRRPCMDCGGVFPPYVMDFDHRDPTKKSFSLTSPRALLKSREELIEEIEKCDIVCANCHRIRTYAAFRDGTLRSPYFARHRLPAATPAVARRREKWHCRRREHIAFLDRIRELPCADCGRRFPPCVMEFDHRDPATKRRLVPYMAGRYRFAALLVEIAKCDIVCANCHRERTYQRRPSAGVAQPGMSGCLPSSRSRVRIPSPAQLAG